MTAPAAKAVAELETLFLEHMEPLEPETCVTAARVGLALGITDQLVKALAAGLRRKGLIAYQRGLWTDDGLPAGAGWSLTDAGRSRLRQGRTDPAAPGRIPPLWRP